MATQFDIIRSQAEAAARNAVSRAAGKLRRDTSLVSRASQLTGKSLRAGEEQLRREVEAARYRRQTGDQPVIPTETRQVPPADGYVRRSPVQPIYEAADYRLKLIRMGVGILALLVAACIAAAVLNRMGVFSW